MQNYLFISILDFITLLFEIAGSIIILMFGARNQKRHEEINNPLIFAFIGIFLISKFVLIRAFTSFLPFISYGSIEEYIELSNFYSRVLLPIITMTFDSIAFGVLFFLLWKFNRNRLGNLYIISGGLWILSSIFDLIVQLAFIVPEYNALYPDQIVLNSSYVALICFACIGLSARVLFVLYSVKIKEKWLVITAVLFVGISINLIIYYSAWLIWSL